MAQGKRVEVSAAQRTEIWRRWKAGESLHEIGQAFGRKHTSIHLLDRLWISGEVYEPLHQPSLVQTAA